jgi:hypothetical protein
MKKYLATAALAALVLVAVVVPGAPGAQNPVVHSATGAGHQDDVDVATGEVFNRTFSFSAVQYADGTANGNAQIASRKFPARQPRARDPHADRLLARPA